MIKRTSALAAILLASALCLTAPDTGHAAAFMKLGDIRGETTDSKHKDWIIIESMSSPIFSTGDINIGIGELQEIPFEEVKEVDASTPKILEALVDGSVLVLRRTDDEGPNLTRLFMEARENGGFEDLVIIAGINGNSCKISIGVGELIGYSWKSGGNSPDGDVPVEEITLGYTEVEWTYVRSSQAESRR